MSSKTKSFYAAEASDFLNTDSGQILGILSTRVGLLHQGDERQQIAAWEKQIEILKQAIASQEKIENWQIFLELPLQRLARRIDTILKIGDSIACIEFKIGSRTAHSNDIDQTVDYALCLRDFHSGSYSKKIYPILCAEHVSTGLSTDLQKPLELVAPGIIANSLSLGNILAKIAPQSSGQNSDVLAFDQSTYNPTPSIVEAAQKLFSGHSVKEIGRTDANADDLARTEECLNRLVQRAKNNREHVICFVTGEPGSGKTLLGLNLAFAVNGGPTKGDVSALLSGNPPLVRVLQEAIAEDAVKARSIKKSEARQQAIQGLQNLLGYLREHEASTPPENIIIYDEAQRAWNEDVGKKLLNREASEPKLFLEIMARLPWACLVCLVGPGQEINRGEDGLPLWGEALSSPQNRHRWKIISSQKCLNGSDSLPGLLSRTSANSLNLEIADELHLRSNLRSYRNSSHGDWVKHLLNSQIEEAAKVATAMKNPPAIVTRDLEKAKSWLRSRARGGHRTGLFASSNAVRLSAEGILVSPRSNELDAVVHWFLKPQSDFRSSFSLEKPLSEFVCQGLEIDYGCLCWGHDLIWQNDNWHPRKMISPNWSRNLKSPNSEFRINAYRVLLTRTRAGLIIYVPKGSDSDQTRCAESADQTFQTLVRAGCSLL